jgi:DNA-binding transcriptional regulator YiaG
VWVTIPEFVRTLECSKAELAALLDVDVSQVHRWANGDTVPEGATLVRLFLFAAGKIGVDEIPQSSRRGRQKRLR